MSNSDPDLPAGERWDQVWGLFHQALELPARERPTFLESACPNDAELRAEALDLLAHHDAAGAALGQPPRIAAPEGDEDRWIGRTIGPYHLTSRLGSGGMGTVYAAEQREPVKRRVALKLIRHRMPNRELVARFNSERQALALMTHSGIAQVLDMGATEGGQPYYVMEQVAGVPITDFCQREKLSTHQRVELMAKVCEAVQHAHQKGVIHRDLKPANILVKESGEPKIIDFGLAKILQPEFAGHAAQTRLGSVLGTPEYMSPEQWVSGSDVDTRTDVYSLGVVLYEILTGDLPLDLRDQPWGEAARIMTEVEPRRPSAQVAASHPNQRRANLLDPDTLRRELARDMDWVALRALEKDRERRYSSASELAEDLRRYLRHQPVLAGPPGAVYQARKFARRHRLAVAATAAFLLALLAGLAGTLRMGQIAARQRDAAQREAEISRASTEFLQDMLGASDSGQSSFREEEQRDLRVVDVVQKARDQLEKSLEKQPLVEASLALTLGKALDSLDDMEGANALLRRSVALRSELLLPSDPDLLESRLALARHLLDNREYFEAEALLREVFELQRDSLGPENAHTLETATLWGGSLGSLGRYDEKVALYEQVAKVFRRELDPGWQGKPLDALSIVSMTRTAETPYGRPEDRELLRALIEARATRFGSEHPATLDAKLALGMMLMEETPSQSETLCREVVRPYRALYGPGKRTLDATTCLNGALETQQKWAEAELTAREVQAVYEELHQPIWFNPGTTLLIRALHFSGKPVEAEKLARAEYERRAASLSPDTVSFWTGVMYVIWSLQAQQRFKEAEVFLLRHTNDPRAIRSPTIQLRAASLAVFLYSAWGNTDKLEDAQARRAAIHAKGRP